jgi:hypothetical protein
VTIDDGIVYAGFSLGVMPRSRWHRPDLVRGAIFSSAAMPTSDFGGSWPDGVPLQIHMMDRDPWAEEDLPAAEALVAEIDGAELLLYPGRAACSPTRAWTTTSRRPDSSRSVRSPSWIASG